MTIENLTTLITIILAISLASERLVTIIKTVFPRLADEKKTDAQEVDLQADKGRRFLVQFIAFLCAWLTSSFLVDGKISANDIFGVVKFGKIGQEYAEMPVYILGLLASGGSAFWTSILGYVKAVKDIRVTQRANASLQYHLTAMAAYRTPIDGGQAVLSNKDRETAYRNTINRAKAEIAILETQLGLTTSTNLNGKKVAIEKEIERINKSIDTTQSKIEKLNARKWWQRKPAA